MTCQLCDDTGRIRTAYAFDIDCQACADPPELCAGCGLPLDDCDVHRVDDEEAYHCECIALSPVLLSRLIVAPALAAFRTGRYHLAPSLAALLSAGPDPLIPPAPALPREFRSTVIPAGGES